MDKDPVNDLLERGIAALKAGLKEEAHQLLSQVVEQDERNEMAWLWISGVVDTDTERRICLENVLAINPNNGIAKRGLERLGVAQRISPFSTVQPLSPGTTGAAAGGERPIQALAPEGEPDEASAPAETEPKEEEGELESAPPPRRTIGRRPALLFGLGAGLLIVVCIGIAGIWWVTSSDLLAPVPTTLPTIDLGRAATAGANSMTISAVQSTWTPRPTDIPSTPIPTWTPRPTNTPLLTWTPSTTPTATMTGTVAAMPTSAIIQPPTWTPPPTSTLAATLTLPPTWTPNPIATPAPGLTLPPTWTPNPTITPAPGLTLPPTWTPAYASSTPTVTPTLTLTGTLTGTPVTVTVTPGD